jgi:hypothetical protein
MPSAPVFLGNYSFAIAEGLALKQKLQGFQVIEPATGNPRNIGVWFRLIEAEVQDRTYPHLALDLVGIQFAADRAQRSAGYIPPLVTPFDLINGDVPVYDDMPLPWSLIYQITTLAQEPRHDLQLQQLIFFQFPQQYGQLDMTDFDGTVRRADHISYTPRSTIDVNQKKLYRGVHEIAVSAEFYLPQAQQVQQIASAQLDVSNNGGPDEIFTVTQTTVTEQ